MLLIIGIILSLLETKEGLKQNKKRAIMLLIFIFIVSLLYIYKEKIPSIMNVIIKLKEQIYD